ncbi:MAG TPA: inorganic diphosphatase [Solirubrobacteraceae bacterium]|nr:inorganic diphosphatase [Solirubrobacteraceae bacterium]
MSGAEEDGGAALVRCVVEIPKGSRNKYEHEPGSDAIMLDRFLSASVVYPTDYGYVPGTLAEDGDPLDVLICVSEPTFPGCVVMGRVVGLFDMEDEHGLDAKLLCVPRADPNWSAMRDLDDLPSQLRSEIAHFFSIYKDLDASRHSEVRGWRDRRAALAELAEARARFARTNDRA